MFVEKDDSDTDDEATTNPNAQPDAVDHVQDPAEDDLRASIQLGAASLPTENVRNTPFQPVVPDIYETRNQSLVEAIQRMQRAEGQLQNPIISSSSAAKDPEVISISSSSAQEIITISSTSAHSSSAQETDIFDQETIELELNDDVFNPIEGASNQADAVGEASTSGLGWGSLQPGWEEKLETAAKEKEEEVEAEAKAKAEAAAKTKTETIPIPDLPLGAAAIIETVATRKGTGKGKGSYDRVIAGAIKKSRNARNANSLWVSNASSTPNTVTESQSPEPRVINISTSSEEDSVQVLGAVYRPTGAIRPTPRPDLDRPIRLDRPTRLAPEPENQSNDWVSGASANSSSSTNPSADTSGNYSWGSWDDINTQAGSIVGFRIPHTPNVEMGDFASNSTISTVDLSEID